MKLTETCKTCVSHEPRAGTNGLCHNPNTCIDAIYWKPLQDSGSHYRHEYRGVKLDIYRIADIYKLTDHALFSALKKILAAGDRGGKDYRQDITEARDALNRKLEMMNEDN